MSDAKLLDLPAESWLTRYRVGDSEPMSEAILEAFDREWAEGGDDSPVLYEQIEPDALDQMFRHTGGDPQIVVRLWDHTVHLTRDTVTIYEAD